MERETKAPWQKQLRREEKRSPDEQESFRLSCETGDVEAPISDLLMDEKYSEAPLRFPRSARVGMVREDA